MMLYALIMFIVAFVFAVIAVGIYRGKTEWIHDYHRRNVTDETGYGKAFGKALAVFPATMVFSGVINLLGETVMWGAVLVLVIGLIVGIYAIVRVQKQYNGGIF